MTTHADRETLAERILGDLDRARSILDRATEFISEIDVRCQDPVDPGDRVDLNLVSVRFR